jgi:hypothetical protein
VERLKRALQMLKVPDVDAVLAERLSAPPDEHISPVVRDEPHLLSEKPLHPISEPPPRPHRQAGSDEHPPTPAPVTSAAVRPHAQVEVDLTTVLGDLEGNSTPPPTSHATPGLPPELGQVFADLRAKADDDDGEASEHLALAKTYAEMGMPLEGLGALEVAARSPRYRFEAGSMLARLYRDRGEVARAIEWFERAAEAPANSIDAGRELLYDLGILLQQAGERERALAVFLELDAEAPGYHDVPDRVADLSRQTGG